MKALTGLPTQAYVRVGEEANIPLKDLLTLVKELESNASPAFLARYKPDVAAGLDQRQIHRVRERLQEFVDLSDRRVMILTALNQQDRLTPELRQEIEEALDRRELDDIYAPYRPKARSAADTAVEHGLDGLARYLWTQQPAESDPLAEAAQYVQSGNGVGDVSAALEGARHIVARWLSENREVRRDLRQLVKAHAAVVVHEIPQRRKLSAKDEAARKRVAGLFGKAFKASKISWRQVMQLRRGAREGWLRYAVEMPANEAVEYLLGRLLQQPESGFTLQLSAASRTAFEQYLAVQLEGDVRQEMEDRCDREAVEFYCENLRTILMTPPAGARTVIGLETGRPGGWRAAVVGPDGKLLEAAIVHMDKRDREAAEQAAQRAEEEAAAQEAAQHDQPAESPQSEAHETTAAAEAASDEFASETAEAAGAETPAAEGPAAEETKSSDAAGAAEGAAEEITPEVAPPAEAPAEQVEEPAEEAVAAAEQAPVAAEQASGSTEQAQAPAQAAEQEQPPSEPASSQPEDQEAVGTEAAESEQAAETVEAAVTERPDTEALRAPESSVGADSDAPASAGAAQESSAPAETDAAAEKTAAAQPRQRQAESQKHSGRSKKRKKLERVETPEGDLAELIRRHNADLIAIGNGPGVRQVERFIRVAVKRAGRKVNWTTVNEAGSWIYATSKAARGEFPKAEPAVRAAACLARRLQDPLAEMSKTDPRLLGIGPGHHEVDQKALRDGLRLTLEEIVSAVGVDVNRDPAELLEVAPGMTDRVAKRLVEHHEKKGPFANRQALASTPGLSKAVWEQAAGFLRVPDSDNPLDATGVPPQLYPAAEKLFAAAGVSAAEALANPDRLASVNLDELADESASRAALEAVIRELQPAVRNPRGAFEEPTPTVDIEPIEEPRPGMKVEGVVTNVTSFGVFVDIGAEQDGLVHVSQLPGDLVEDSKPSVKTGSKLTVYVTHYDAAGERLSLSTREPRESSRQRRTSPTARQTTGDRRPDRRGRDRDRDHGDRQPVRRTFGPDRESQKQQEQAIKGMSVDEKLALLGNKFRTKV